MNSVPPFCHQRLRQMRHANEGPAGDVHGGEEALPRHVDDPALQRLLGREGDGVNDEIEAAPFLGDALKNRLQLTRSAHIERHHDRRFELARQRLDIFLCLVIEIGDREFRPERPKGLGAAPGDRLIIGDADDQTPLAFEQLCLDLGNHHVFILTALVLDNTVQRMARNHQFFVGRNDIERDPALPAGYLLPVRRIGGGVEHRAEPGKPLGDPCPELHGVLADACREHEGIEPAQRCRQHSGMQSDAIDEMIRAQRRRADQCSLQARARHCCCRTVPSDRTPGKAGSAPRRPSCPPRS